MKFEITKKTMAIGLKKVASCSEKRALAQSGVLEIRADKENQRIFLKKNNLENCVAVSVGATIIEEGNPKSIYVQCQELLDIVNLMPDGNLCISTDAKVVVKSGKTRMSLPLTDEPFSNWPREPAIAEALLPEVTFKTLVEKVAYSSASDKDQSRPVMSSINVEIKNDVLTMTATDGRRISKASAEIKSTGQEYSCLIPAQQLVDISALLSDTPGDDMSFVVTQNGYRMKVTDKSTYIYGRFINGLYPKIVNTILDKKSENLIEVDREELYRAIDRCAYVSKKGEMLPMILSIGNTLKLYSKNERNTVEDEIFCNIKGKPMSIGLDPAYLKEMLRKYPDDRVSIGYGSERDPILLYAGNQGQTLVVFPVMIRDK